MSFDPDVVALFEAAQAANLPTIDQLEVEPARELYKVQIARTGTLAPELESVRDLEAAGLAGAISLRLYRPHGLAAGAAPLLIFFHGGGWVIGDLDTHDVVCRQIAIQAGCLVVAVDYRLAPEHVAPAAADDCLAAMRWIASHADMLGADPARLAVGGDSAGGNLAAVAALAACADGLPLRAQILIYPSVDLRPDAPPYPSREQNAQVPPLTTAVMDYFRVRYLAGDAPTADWRLSPMVADKTGVAPALVITGEYDVLRDEGRAYADALEAADVPVRRLELPGMIHGFINMGGALKAAGRTIEAIAEELQTRFA